MTDNNLVELSFKPLFAMSKNHKNYRILKYIFNLSQDFINSNYIQDVNCGNITINEERLLFTINKSILTNCTLTLPHFTLLNEVVIEYTKNDENVFELDINEYINDEQESMDLVELTKACSEVQLENNLMANVFYFDTDGKISIKQMTQDEANLFAIENKILSINQVKDKTKDHVKELDNRVTVSIEKLKENQNIFNYDVIDILKNTNINEGILTDEIISDISNVNKYVLVDLTNFEHLSKFAKITKVNITELLKNNTTNVIYDIKDDAVIFKYVNHELQIKTIDQI